MASFSIWFIYLVLLVHWKYINYPWSVGILITQASFIQSHYSHTFCDCSLNRKTFFFSLPISLHAVCSMCVKIILLQDRRNYSCKVNICLCVHLLGSSVLEELFDRTTEYCKWPFCRTCLFRENPEKSDSLPPELFSLN